MQISVSHGNHTTFMPMDVNGIEDVARAALEYSVSTGVFINNYRNINNFKQAEFIGLDIDDGMSIEAAKDVFKDYTHAILPSRNHRVEKNGKVCDRFRVFLQLEQPIDNEKDFYETWYKLQENFKVLDPAAKDPSRQFFSCQSIESINTSGKSVSIRRWKPKEEKHQNCTVSGVKGELGKATLKFLALGAPAGSRNNELYKAARDMYQNNYTQEEALSVLTKICDEIGLDGEEVMNTLDSAFAREPKHEPRVKENAFAPVTVDKLYKQKDTKLNWLMKDLLPMGACSIIAGPPKAGKSTLIRQLSAAVAMGHEKFLNRSVTQGKVLYLALEEQAEVLKAEYRKLGLKGDSFYVFVGSIDKDNIMSDLKGFIEENEISLVVIDTLMVFSNIENSNDYKEAYAAMTEIRELARTTGCHIMCVHHTNKSEFQGPNSIMGSNAFLGGVDVAIIFKALGERRYIQSLQRPGRPFQGEELKYDAKTNTYTIGRKKEKDEKSREF